MLYLVLKSVWYKPYNCPQKEEFCSSYSKKKWLNFDTKSADKLLKVLPTCHWTDSLIIESVLLDWALRSKGDEPIVFPKR